MKAFRERACFVLLAIDIYCTVWILPRMNNRFLSLTHLCFDSQKLLLRAP
jgi:hypothetical protein